MMVDYRKYITMHPNKRFGKPIIAGTRISVYDVLNWLVNRMTEKEILEDFPELDQLDIKACLSFSANKENRIRVTS